MSSRTRALVFLISTPLVAFVIVGGLMGASRPAPQRGMPHLPVFREVVSYIINAYVEDVNVDKVFDGAMRGLSDGLDASSAYLTPDEVTALQANTPPPAGDIGITLTRQFYLRVVGVRDGSSADRAGLQTGDFIRAINDTPTRDLSVFAGSRLLRGAPGSTVSLLVIRGNAADPHKIDVTRETLNEPVVSSRRLPAGQAYVRIASFGPRTAEALQSAVTGLGSAATSGLIVDLRGTADGAPEDGVAAARLFVAKGVLATRAGRDPKDRVVTEAKAGDGAWKMPVVLVVSNGTAQAAEVFAAALSGNQRARLVGEPTAGIAAVQRLFPLPEGHGLWMTYERYLQVDGTPIHDRGLRPDVAVDIPMVDFDEPAPTTDDALGKASDELKRLQAGAPAGPDAASKASASNSPATGAQPLVPQGPLPRTRPPVQ
jgi:carboxyl-terminal processing protease